MERRCLIAAKKSAELEIDMVVVVWKFVCCCWLCEDESERVAFVESGNKSELLDFIPLQPLDEVDTRTVLKNIVLKSCQERANSIEATKSQSGTCIFLSSSASRLETFRCEGGRRRH